MQGSHEHDRRRNPRLSVGSNMCVLCQNGADCLLCRMDDTSSTGMKFSLLNPDRISELNIGDTIHLEVYPDMFQEFITTRKGIVAWIRNDCFGLKLG